MFKTTIVGLAAASAVMALASPARAQEKPPVDVAAAAGYSRYTEGDGLNGLGIDLRGGYKLSMGLVADARLGYRRWTQDPIKFSDFPIHVGARYDLAAGPVVVRPAAHIGLDILSVTAVTPLGTASDTETKLGFDLGVGVDYPVSETMWVGASLDYNVIFDSDNSGTFLSFLLGVRTRI